MRAPSGDRGGSALLAFCLAAILTIVPAAALDTQYHIAQNGTSYHAIIELQETERYEFYEPGLLGDRVPLKVQDVALTGECSPCEFTWSGNSAITFPQGNYTLSFSAPLHENHFMVVFDEPRSVAVSLPQGLDVRNPALGMITPGGIALPSDGNGTTVMWNTTRTAELRFYDEGRENLLYIFANIWIVIAVVLLLPFLLTWRK